MKDEILSVHFNWNDVDKMLEKYKVSELKDGYNTVDGEEIFFISNPAIGLWSSKERFAEMQNKEK